jgi:hypothetical protein
MIAGVRTTEEVHDLGWEHVTELMQQRRRLILEGEIGAAPPLRVAD